MPETENTGRQLIQAVREHANWSMDELAKHLEVTRSTLYKINTGALPLSEKIEAKLTRKLSPEKATQNGQPEVVGQLKAVARSAYGEIADWCGSSLTRWGWVCEELQATLKVAKLRERQTSSNKYPEAEEKIVPEPSPDIEAQLVTLGAELADEVVNEIERERTAKARGTIPASKKA